MALPSLISVDDLEARARVVFSNAEKGWAAVAVRDASTLVRSYMGLTWTNDAGDTLDADIPDSVLTVVGLVADRVWRNPNGRTIEEQLDDHLVKTEHAATFADGLYLTDAEKRMLPPRANTRGLWIQPTTQGPALETDFAPIVYGDGTPGEPVPWVDPYDQSLI